jgi:hypothetical protein
MRDDWLIRTAPVRAGQGDVPLALGDRHRADGADFPEQPALSPLAGRRHSVAAATAGTTTAAGTAQPKVRRGSEIPTEGYSPGEQSRHFLDLASCSNGNRWTAGARLAAF